MYPNADTGSLVNYFLASQQLAHENKADLDAVYTERNNCVALIALMALRLGLKAGIRQHAGDDWEDDWRNVVMIDLPAGQVSWHIHDSEAHKFYFLGVYDGEWDGHTTDEKHRRVLEPGL